MVYFIQGKDGGPIKIGTTIRLAERLRQLRTDYGRDFTAIAVVDGRFAEEREIHRRFDHLRMERELFEPAAELLDFIRENGKSWDESDDEPPRRNDVAVKLDADVARFAKIAAQFKKMSLAEYLGEVVGPIADRDIDEEFERRKKASPSQYS